MRIGTTPTHTFELPPEIAGIAAKVRVIYVQQDKVVLEKETTQLTENVVVFKLTQEETLRFSHGVQVKIQLRILTVDGNALTSDVYLTYPHECLENEVLA